MNRCVIVLGIRSGTSALTGVLKILGLHTGKSELLSPTDDNAKGYFENQAIVRFNENLVEWRLADILTGQPWFAEKTLKALIKREFGAHKHIVIKDPRICMLKPLYKRVLTGIGYQIKYLVAYRKREEIVRSLMKAHQLGYTEAVRISKGYQKLQFQYTEGEDCFNVGFAELVYKPYEILPDLMKFLGLKKSYLTVQKTVEAFIDPRLKHHNL